MNGEAVLIDTSCWIEAMRRQGDAEIRSQVAVLVEEALPATPRTFTTDC